ncbi:hypothetical protein N4T77_10245, partial [Clostridium sp. CX1]|nr:hypothetical protein [Clostridium sp. CX1]
PEWGRYLNADALVGAVGDLLSHNLFIYCGNNPINCEDTSGNWGIRSFLNKAYALVTGLVLTKVVQIQQTNQRLVNNIKNIGQKIVSKVVNSFRGNPRLYRKMSLDESGKTLKQMKLQPAIKGKEPTKWLSESLDKVRNFTNKSAISTEERIIEFEMNPNYYRNIQQTAIPQQGSRGMPQVKYHYEGLPEGGQLRNYGITPQQIELFNESIINVRIVK